MSNMEPSMQEQLVIESASEPHWCWKKQKLFHLRLKCPELESGYGPGICP